MGRILGVVTGLLLVATVDGHAGDITSCGQELADFEVGELVDNLTCGPGAGFGVRLGRRGELRLNGHTITIQNALGDAVRCGERRCTVTGPGAIVGPGSASALGRGIIGFVQAGGLLSITDVAVSGFEGGIYTQSRGRVVATNVIIHDNNVGFSIGSLRATDVTSEDNLGGGIAFTRRVHGTGITSRRNFTGLFGPKIAADGLEVVDNRSDGISATRVVLSNGTVTGNGFATATPFDLVTVRPPVLENVTCGVSQMKDEPPGTTWGVCTND